MKTDGACVRTGLTVHYYHGEHIKTEGLEGSAETGDCVFRTIYRPLHATACLFICNFSLGKQENEFLYLFNGIIAFSNHNFIANLPRPVSRL